MVYHKKMTVDDGFEDGKDLRKWTSTLLNGYLPWT
jgi:hypothetical protein